MRIKSKVGADKGFPTIPHSFPSASSFFFNRILKFISRNRVSNFKGLKVIEGDELAQKCEPGAQSGDGQEHAQKVSDESYGF
jgi:hypothetical protein